MTMSTQSDDVTLDFSPIRGYSAGDVPAEAPEGSWTALFTVAKRGATQDKGDGMRFPMLTLDVKLETANEEENAFAEGTHLKEWIVIYPPGLGGKTNMLDRLSKERLAAIGEALGFDPASVLPADITTLGDLDQLVSAIDGNRGNIWTKVVPDKKTGEKRVRIFYSAPKRGRN